MHERPSERGLRPSELEREEAEPHNNEWYAGARQHEQCKAAQESREAAERDEHADEDVTLPVSLPPLAQTVERGHATAAPNSSPSLRSR